MRKLRAPGVPIALEVVSGPAEIAEELEGLFADHLTPVFRKII